MHVREEVLQLVDLTCNTFHGAPNIGTVAYHNQAMVVGAASFEQATAMVDWFMNMGLVACAYPNRFTHHYLVLVVFGK